MPVKLLITAFDAFGGEEDNISELLLRALPAELDGAELCKLTLPTVFGRAAELAIEAAEALRPDAIVCLGQAAARRAITPERVAINLMDAARPDNAGRQPCDEPIEPGGPAACFATLPVKAMTEAIRAEGVPAELSCTAGAYVCNSLMYAMLRYAARCEPEPMCGFIHLPRPSAALGQEALERGLLAALRAVGRRLNLSIGKMQ